MTSVWRVYRDDDDGCCSSFESILGIFSTLERAEEFKDALDDDRNVYYEQHELDNLSGYLKEQTTPLPEWSLSAGQDPYHKPKPPHVCDDTCDHSKEISIAACFCGPIETADEDSPPRRFAEVLPLWNERLHGNFGYIRSPDMGEPKTDCDGSLEPDE